MDLDLNLEPSDQTQDSVVGLDVILNELEIAHGHIEERIRQLEAVTTRARQRQRWRQGRPLLPSVDTTTDSQSDGRMNIRDNAHTISEQIGQTEKTSKLNGGQLVAKALGMDSDSKTSGSKSGGFFDCNVCLHVAKDPILTCCGHLFCWSCFYQLSYIHSNTKECPECLGEVTDTSIIPIYGNTNDNNSLNLKVNESGLRVPPRPRAQRIESIRQTSLSRGAPSPPIGERIQQITNMIGVMEEQSLSQDLNSVGSSSERNSSLVGRLRSSQVLPTSRREVSDRRSLRVSRILLQGAASFSSLSSALNSAMDSAERLVEDLETYIHNYRLRRSHQHPLDSDDRDSLSNLATVIQPDSQSAELSTALAGGINSLVPNSESSSRQMDSSANAVYLDRHTSDAAEINLTTLTSPPSRRRADIPRVSDGGHEPSRDSRRRRLR